MLELALRLVFSLAVVLGLLLLIAKLGSRRFRGQHGALVQVLHRQPLTRGTSVSVVAVGSRVLVLGTTEQQVRVLAELDPDEVALPQELPELDAEVVTEAPAPAPGAHRADVPAVTAARSASRASRAADGPLAGSVLSVDTWRQALAAATRRAS